MRWETSSGVGGEIWVCTSEVRSSLRYGWIDRWSKYVKVTKLLLTVSLATLIFLGVTDAYAQSAKANSCPDGSTPNCIPAEDTYFLWRGRQITDPASNIREDQKLEYSRRLRRFPTFDSCLSADTEPGGPPIENRLAWDRFLRNSDAVAFGNTSCGISKSSNLNQKL